MPGQQTFLGGVYFALILKYLLLLIFVLCIFGMFDILSANTFGEGFVSLLGG